MRHNVDFWYWFWQEPAVHALAEKHGFAVLPKRTRDFVVSRFISDMQCNGKPVFQTSPALAIEGTRALADLFSLLCMVYKVLNEDIDVAYTSGPPLMGSQIVASLETRMLVLTLAAPPEEEGVETIPFAGIGLALVSRRDLVLDVATLVKVLNGEITTWLHPAIIDHNPAAAVVTGAREANQSQSIQLLIGPEVDVDALHKKLRGLSDAYTGGALRSARAFRQPDALHLAAANNPFALAITRYSRAVDGRLRLVGLARGGVALRPSLATIEACFAAASDTHCWPLTYAVHVSLRRSRCDPEVDGPRTVAAHFVQWLFTPEADRALEGDGVVPLRHISAFAPGAAETLASIACSATHGSSILTVLVVVLAGAGALVLAVPFVLPCSRSCDVAVAAAARPGEPTHDK